MTSPHLLPGAIYDPLPRDADNRYITPRLIVLHSNANKDGTSTAQKLWSYIRRVAPTNKNTTQPHVQIDLDGTVTQGLPFNEFSVTQASANSFAIGVETADYGAKSLPTTRWTPGQAKAIAELIAHCSMAYGIPIARAGRWDGSGVAAHRDHPQYSIHRGKTCPGDARVAQIPEILEAARRIVDHVEIAPQIPPYAPEFGLWGPMPAIGHGSRPTLFVGAGYGPGFDALWVKYVQGVLRKAGYQPVTVTGLYDHRTAEAVLEEQIKRRPGMAVAGWGNIGLDDWPWIDQIAGS